MLNTIVIHTYKEIFLPECRVKENAEIQMILGDFFLNFLILFYFLTLQYWDFLNFPYKRHLESFCMLPELVFYFDYLGGNCNLFNFYFHSV